MTNFLFYLFALLFDLNASFAADQDLCKYFKYCGGKSRSSSQSLPSSSSAATLNPSNISSVRGFGIESIYQQNNPLRFDLVTGNGKIGALLNPSLENSFFGNRSIEIDDSYYIRKIHKTQYKNKKLNLAVGLNLIDKTNFALDLGLSAKRNPDIKKINPGFGVSARLFSLNFGAYFSKDDIKINLGSYINPYNNLLYSSIYNSSTYLENFLVKTFTIGTKINNLSLDYGLILTKYNFYTESTQINLYSGSYVYKKFLFNLAFRQENSPNMSYLNNQLIIQRKKMDIYYGAEFLANRFFVFGLQYNYFLLNEVSASLTIFI
ncbi:MAG: hypothetical protein Q7U04_04000 [Bacteriovorax sp.]|nr:hypothetical protein [Bacteriovorax sp.]